MADPGRNGEADRSRPERHGPSAYHIRFCFAYRLFGADDYRSHPPRACNHVVILHGILTKSSPRGRSILLCQIDDCRCVEMRSSPVLSEKRRCIYEAPAAPLLEKEMSAFLAWANDSGTGLTWCCALHSPMYGS